MNYNLLSALILTGQCLDKVSSYKYLRIFIDIHFSWRDHIDQASDKASKNINIMTMIKRFRRIQCLINIYHPLVNPYLIFTPYSKMTAVLVFNSLAN